MGSCCFCFCPQSAIFLTFKIIIYLFPPEIFIEYLLCTGHGPKASGCPSTFFSSLSCPLQLDFKQTSFSLHTGDCFLSCYLRMKFLLPVQWPCPVFPSHPHTYPCLSPQSNNTSSEKSFLIFKFHRLMQFLWGMNLISVVKLPSSVWWRKNSLPHQTISSMMADNGVFVQFYIPNTYSCAWTKPKLQLTHASRVRGGDGESRKMEHFQDQNKIFMKL